MAMVLCIPGNCVLVLHRCLVVSKMIRIGTLSLHFHVTNPILDS